MEEADGRLEETDDCTDSLEPVQPACWFFNMIEDVEKAEEQLIPHAHDKQHWLGCVVKTEDGVAREVNGLVAGRSLHH